MKRSELFTKTSKTVPADEASKNAQLLIRAGYIYKEMAGVYAYLPLGLAVIEKIKAVVRDEMTKLGGQEIIMTNLQRQDLWQTTDRWDDAKVDIWFKSKLKNETEVGLAWSHEEPITNMMTNFVSSYRDLPVYVFQFQTKLRNELRAKSGILRGREFIMKDLYSYSKDEPEHLAFYNKATDAYLKTFERLGIGDKTFVTYASGGAFTEFSHEFQTLTDSGEDTIFLDRTKKLAVNKEILNDDIINKLGLNKDQLEEVTASEVGNIFSFGEHKSEQLGLKYTDESGHEKSVVLGSYGIGVTRLMGVVTELFSDNKGLVWPEVIAPARVYLIAIGSDEQVINSANELYSYLTTAGVEVIYDDRNTRPGEMFADADLMGIPYRIVISDKTVSSGNYEWKARISDQVEQISRDEVVKKLAINS